MEKYIDKLEEYIKDEDIIVTVPSLATSLNISIQESQQVLEKYIELNGTSNSVCVSYVLNGTLKGSKASTVLLVKQTDLKERKSLFADDLNCSVYSVQKSPNLNYNVIALVDKFSEVNVRDKPLAGSVISKNCVKRILKLKKLPPPPAPTLKGKSSFFTKQSSEKSSEKPKEEKSQENNAKPKTNGIASMFSRAASNSAHKKSEEKVTKKSPPKQNGKISGFFTKSSTTTGSANSISTFSKNSSVKSEDSIKTEGIIEELMDVDFNEFVEEAKETKLLPEIQRNEGKVMKDKPKKAEKTTEKEKTSCTEKKNVTKAEKKKKRNRSRSAEKNSKRRKRIVVQDDSDSDDIFQSEESNDDVVENSEEEPDKAPAVTVKKPLAPKNKKRVAVDKTYVDEEGFVVTKVEYEFLSASEDEEVTSKPSVKVEEKPKLKTIEKKNSSNSENDENPIKSTAKGKKGKKAISSGSQPTLMNFFKKK